MTGWATNSVGARRPTCAIEDICRLSFFGSPSKLFCAELTVCLLVRGRGLISIVTAQNLIRLVVYQDNIRVRALADLRVVL
jgi:hypothetical protein